MTKRDYIAIADAIDRATFVNNESAMSKETLIDLLAYYMAKDNPRFNENQFRVACGPIAHGPNEIAAQHSTKAINLVKTT